ncbi:hypothetical protein BJ912DRAFT_965197 [Pholiota molesta]|nr:hypothetical protein BJ912DRAFT_965197 [Pholiota molesta]
MSLPPRPLLRSRWAWAAREHIQKHLKLSPNSRHFSSSTPQHAATISFRRAHSFADMDAPVTPARAFPIDIIDHQVAVREFYASIAAGESEKARQVLFDLVDRHTPDSNLDVFRQLRSIVLHSDKPDINILLALGLSLASKGYADFVKDEIAPAVEELGTAQVFSKFQAVLEKLKDTIKKPKATPQVFEEASDDYADVLSRFPLPPPSVMELIQQQLSPLLPDQTTKGQSIFEEETGEYSLHALSPSKVYTRNRSASVLLDLVMDRRFEEAYSLLKEMENVKTPIPPSHLYEVAALDVLRNEALSAENRADRFTQWFSLIPPIHAANPPRDFAEVRYRIQQSTTLHLTVMRRCALILASKGYTNKFLRQFIPTIFFYNPPENFMKFILDLERRTLNYWLERDPLNALERARYTSENIRGVAVCSMTYGGHIDGAMNLINNPKINNGVTFPVHVYDILLKRLKTFPRKSRYRSFIPVVTRHRAERLAADEARGRVPRSFFQSTILASTVDSLSPPADRTDLPAMLRYLRKAIFLDDPHRILPSILTDFIEAYSLTGRTSALRQLLDKALDRSHKATKLFLFAEMRYYRQRQQFDLLIKTFVQHFYVAGVPREEVQRWYDKITRNNLKGQDDSLTRLTELHPHTLLREGKLWPDLEQCHLVWEALVIKAQRNPAALMTLYKKFVHYAKHAEDPTAHPAHAAIAPLPMPTRFGRAVSGPAFHAFMQHMLPLFGPDFGHTILADMWASTSGLGSGERARAGGPAPPRPAQEAAAAEERDVQLVRPPSEADGPVPLFMQPDAPFYINIMQGLLYSMNADAAEEVYRRLQKRCPCRPGRMRLWIVLLAARAPAQSAPKPINALWSKPLVMVDQEVSQRRR